MRIFKPYDLLRCPDAPSRGDGSGNAWFRRVWRGFLAVWLAACICPAATPVKKARKPKPPGRIVPAAIEAVGLKRFPAEAFIAALGVRAGAPATAADFDQAVSRLTGSGMFRAVTWKTRVVKRKTILTFSVQENDQTVPVYYENLIWFPDEEIDGKVRNTFPLFDGRVDESGILANTVRATLETMVREKGIQGTVKARLACDFESGDRRFTFALEGADLRVAGVSVTGVSPGLQRDVRQACDALTEREYSRSGLDSFTRLALMPVFRRHGRMKAVCGTPTVTLDPGPGAGTRIRVTIPVEEGPVCRLGNLSWQGATEFTDDRLGALLGLKAGEPYDEARLQAGFGRVLEVYNRRAFYAAKVTFDLRCDAAGSRADLVLTVAEGEAFRMGRLEFSGLSPDRAERIRKEWRLQPGTPFEPEYPAEFVRGNGEKLARAYGASRDARRPVTVAFRHEIRPNLDRATVDVVISPAN